MTVVAIDMGLGTFASLTCSTGSTPWLIKGGALKSVNAYYNEQYSIAVRKGDKKRMNRLNKNRNGKIKKFFTAAIQTIIKYCEINNAKIIAIGKYIGSEVKEKGFISLPYNLFYRELEKELTENGITYKYVDEKYTSGTSFLDRERPQRENYNKSRRYKGLFYSKSGVINANVNDSYQIMAKAFPDSIEKGRVYSVKPKIIKMNII